MKKLILLFLIPILTINFSIAQKKRVSPREIVSGQINQVNIKIDYGSPSVKNRKIWGGLVPFNQIWRAGANESTTFEFDNDVIIENEKIPAGKYSFFVIPNEMECTVVFNKDHKQWGAYNYDINKDQLRINVKPKVLSESTEKLVYIIYESYISLKWSTWTINFNIE